MLNINELREAISEQIQEIRLGKGDLKKAKAIGSLSHELCNTYRLEMQYYKTAGKKAQLGTFLPPPVNEEESENKQ